MQIPEGHLLITWPTGEVAIWKDAKLLDLKSGEIRATVVREARTIEDLTKWVEREPL